nr:DNA repair protein RAD51 homolog 3-like [Leptinotarsa decemlineata]
MGIKKDPDVDLNEKTILKNIHCIKIDTTLELLACLTYLRQYLVDKNIRLIVIDSVSYLLRQLDVSNRIVVISKIFLELRVLAEHFNFAVILTNDFTTRVDGEVTLVTPSFGDSFYHLVNSRIILSKTGVAFRAKLVKSIFYGCKEVEFNI